MSPPPAAPEPKTLNVEHPRKSLRSRLQIRRPPPTPALKPTTPPRKNIIAVLREWHSRAGLVAFAFLIWLACTGVLLTRSVEFGFDTARVEWPWLTRMYGLHAEPPQSGFRVGPYWLAATHDYTLLNGKPLATKIDTPLGVVVGGTADAPLLFVAGPASLVLVSATGERLDELVAPILPVSQIRRVGVLKNDAKVIAVQDLDAYQSSDEGNSWAPVSPTEVAWSQAEALSETERDALIEYSKPRIIVEQLLIDLHSGRLFGPIGAWAITLIGLVTMVLAVSGIWMWWRIRQNRRRLTSRA